MSPDNPRQVAFSVTRRHIRWAVGGIIIFLVVGGIASLLFQVSGRTSEVAMRTRNVTLARSVYPAIKMYAGEHGGHYPSDLFEIYPRYISAADAVRYRDQSGRKYDW